MRFCFDVGIGGVDMLVPAELRQSGSLPCLSVAVRWKARARAPWQPRWGTEKRDGGRQSVHYSVAHVWLDWTDEPRIT